METQRVACRRTEKTKNEELKNSGQKAAGVLFTGSSAAITFDKFFSKGYCPPVLEIIKLTINSVSGNA